MWVGICATKMKYLLQHLTKTCSKCWNLNKYKNGLVRTLYVNGMDTMQSHCHCQGVGNPTDPLPLGFREEVSAKVNVKLPIIRLYFCWQTMRKMRVRRKEIAIASESHTRTYSHTRLSVRFSLSYTTAWGKSCYLGHLHVFISNTGSTSPVLQFTMEITLHNVFRALRTEPCTEQALSVRNYY